MRREVFLLSHPDDSAPVEELARRLRDAEFEPMHHGMVRVGDSPLAVASSLLSRGLPVVICGTPRAAVSRLVKSLSNAANTRPGAQVFVVQMEPDMDLDHLSLTNAVAPYWEDPDAAFLRLKRALDACFPQPSQAPVGSAEVAGREPDGPVDFLEATTAGGFNRRAVDDFIQRLRPAVAAAQFTGVPTPPALLRAAGVIVGDRLTRTGLLLFGARPRDALPSAVVQCTQFYGTERTARRDKIPDLDQNIQRQIVGAWQFVADRVRDGEQPTSSGPYAEAVYRYPMLAVREVIANALVHRDYQASDMCVHVRLFTDRLEVTSPGSWGWRELADNEPKSLADLAGESRRRNFRLASTLTWISLVEGEGSGIPTAVDECDRVGAPRPVVVEHDGHVTVVIRPMPIKATSPIVIVYAARDRIWAEWLRGWLTAAGLQTVLHCVQTSTSTPGDFGQVFVVYSRDLAERMLDVRTITGPADGSGPGSAPSLPTLRVDASSQPVWGNPVLDVMGVGETRALEQIFAALEVPFDDQRAPGASGTGTAVSYPNDRLPASWRIYLVRNPRFIGRAALMEQIRDWFQNAGAGGGRMALVGLPGIGKTQIALEYAYRFGAAYETVWWINAAQPDRVRMALVDLARTLEIPGDDEELVAGALEALRRGDRVGRWLIVLDNADSPRELHDLLPFGSGHVLITSRNPQWNDIASVVDVDVFDRVDSVELLGRRTAGVSLERADELAATLGDLPLALEQARTWLFETAMVVDEYLRLLSENTARLMDEGAPVDHQVTLFSTVRLAHQALLLHDPAAAVVLELCAELAPEPIPIRLILGQVLTDILASIDPRMHDPLLQRTLYSQIARHSLARIDSENSALVLHRLTQDIIHSSMDPEQRRERQDQAQAILAAAERGHPEAADNWPTFEALLPHLRPPGSLRSAIPAVRKLVLDTVTYLNCSGQHLAAGDLAQEALREWLSRSSAQDPTTEHLYREYRRAQRAQGRDDDATSFEQ
ncbi:hypothetical protein GCM10010172_44220 [Paractinoplanes ferrugineus]|uniref:Uncharacterized protein n=1 Tax=Paractinoplanes ferrugineus TaxID=113564 RepID=A0A919J443_9ACTN|nr:FxSxx-COOH system tetratricopeptide repeat protein [Actinoplanes ferrugineus]GIE13580.1 hypothetical protein Afe05nite_54200 [Actinoplanes ferrugineus]